MAARRSFRDCCFPLSRTIPGSDPYRVPGGVVWLRQIERGGLLISVTGFLLPPPSYFDPSFDAYVIVFEDLPIVTRQMTRLEPTVLDQEWTWTRSQSYGSPVDRVATLAIHAGHDFQPMGPVVLRGRFARCH